MNTPDCLLSCGCWKRLRLDLAVPGAIETCPRHSQSPIYVVKVNAYEWHVRCQSEHCRYGRWFGQSEGLARQANGRHATRSDHLGGVAYDRITWDGKGSVYRDSGQRVWDRKPKNPPVLDARKLSGYRDVVVSQTYPEPPF